MQITKGFINPSDANVCLILNHQICQISIRILQNATTYNNRHSWFLKVFLFLKLSEAQIVFLNTFNKWDWYHNDPGLDAVDSKSLTMVFLYDVIVKLSKILV